MNSETLLSVDGPSQSGQTKVHDWNALIASFLGWTLDAFDFFIVVMVLTEIAAEYHRTNAEIALTLTLTLALRPIGAFIFGLAADRFGRRTPLMVDVVAYSIIEVASGFAPNFTTFLILRALFGVAMGGEWGVGASLAMESVPAKWRGVLSGFLQQGYALGYLLACFAYFFVMPHFGWRAMFFIGGAPALLALYIRGRVKESEVWRKTQRNNWSDLWASIRARSALYPLIALAAVAIGYALRVKFLTTPAGMAALFVTALIGAFMGHTIWKVAAGHRRLFCYLVVFMMFMGFASHGTQDMYPTFLKVQHGFTARAAAVVTAIASVGSILGGALVGSYSDLHGRRRAMILAFMAGVCVIPLWAFASGGAWLAVGAFLLQFMVQGAWGIVPAYITELSPDHIRGFLPGFAYQCGMLLAGGVAYLEATLANHTSYSNAMALTALVVFVGAAVVVSLGKEKHGIEFGQSPPGKANRAG